VIDKKFKNFEYFKYMSTMITNKARCTQEIKPCIAMAKLYLKVKNSFQHKLNQIFRKLQNCNQ